MKFTLICIAVLFATIVAQKTNKSVLVEKKGVTQKENKKVDDNDDDDLNVATTKKPTKPKKQKTKTTTTKDPNKTKKPKTAKQKKKFEEWKRANNITEEDDDDEAEDNYVDNDERITKHNSRSNKTFEQAHNKFSDKSYEQNKRKRGGIKIPSSAELTRNAPMVRSGLVSDSSLPKSVNYTKHMQPMKDQKDCGACYAFSVLAALEYEAKIAKKNLVASEQSVIDCDSLQFGCEGGWPGRVFEYARDVGIADGRKYKYANSRQMCMSKLFAPIMNVTNYCQERLDGDEQALKALVAKRPVVITFSLTIDFMYYKKGVFSDPTCGTSIDHSMLVVGYGTEKLTKKNYWIVRNSWGKGWGMGGYAWIARNASNMCGIATWAMYIC